ncbi:MAG: NfeD family protein [Sandarakinorhabdus sp.]|nr:NfeD family protein [Sandarakinorhabdus sp.]MBS3961967.1 NfeD family protein [Sandarakinorhabdus sp.]
MEPPAWAAPFFTAWGWLSLAAITAGLEIVMPGAFMLWLSAAALATALSVAVFGFGWGWQLVAFALFAVAAILGSLRWKTRNPITSDDPALNRRGMRMIGETVVVVAPIIGGQGRVKLGDGEWIARGPDAPLGARMRITGADGSILNVEPDA